MKQLFESSPAAASPVPADYKASLFGHPDDVLSNPDLTPAEKRAILASWVSDVRAVENAPSLRQLDNGATVSIDVVLQALKSLDAGEGQAERLERKSYHMRPAARRKSSPIPDWLRRAVRLDHFDDDDSPPSAPAAAAIPRRLSPPRVEAVQTLRSG
ncbi:hypothetical protein PY365_07580 [Roseiarcaceae bacterium H3SJ34-1]|uniref:hypothetical protein n=1 Tax=Terripilifer ovatus TaxID=3032367 RepID=UPI003AB99F63|nr:hypothetical protein [Roseiarcaceae bacterium H3SJ34-1]